MESKNRLIERKPDMHCNYNPHQCYVHNIYHNTTSLVSSQNEYSLIYELKYADWSCMLDYPKWKSNSTKSFEFNSETSSQTSLCIWFHKQDCIVIVRLLYVPYLIDTYSHSPPLVFINEKGHKIQIYLYA